MENSMKLHIHVMLVLAVFALSDLAGCVSSGGNSAPKQEPAQTSPAQLSPSGQAIKLSSNANGEYAPKEIRVKAGSTVRIEGDINTLVGGMDTIVIDGYNLNKKVSPGDNVLEFTADKPGEYSMHCANNMGYGKLVVVN